MKIRQLNKAIPSSGLHCTALPSSRMPKLIHSVEVCESEKQRKGGCQPGIGSSGRHRPASSSLLLSFLAGEAWESPPPLSSSKALCTA